MNKITDFNEKDSLAIKLLISNATKGVTNNGSPYLTLTLQDDSGSIDGKYWDISKEQTALIEAGKVYEVHFDVLSYRGVLQAKIHKINAVDQAEIDLVDFVKHSDIPKNQLQAEIKSYINMVENPIISKLVIEIMKEYHEEFFEYPAASKNHHNYVGGLATHVLGMLKVANQLCDTYPILSRDLMIAGVILHDIGKTVELSGPFMTEYTKEGKLLGHISIMQAKIFEVAEKFNLAECEEVTLIRHMVLSHHGQYEYGSPVLPMIIEAEMLQFVDNIDARVEALTKAFEETDEDSFTSRIFSLENRSFYKHNK